MCKYILLLLNKYEVEDTADICIWQQIGHF